MIICFCKLNVPGKLTTVTDTLSSLQPMDFLQCINHQLVVMFASGIKGTINEENLGS